VGRVRATKPRGGRRDAERQHTRVTGMRWMLFGFFWVLAAGCGAGTTNDTQIPVGDVSRVTDEIRSACASLDASDTTLASLIAAAETDRNNGVSREDATAGIVAACALDPDKAVPCEACLRAIIGEVYGPS